MGLFDTMLGSDQTLFKNPDALESAFVPKMIPYREEQQRKIATAIQPLFSDRTGKNLVLYGMPGVGKTVACKHVLDELEEKTEDIITVYINCWEKNTSYKVVMEMCNALGYVFTQNKKTDELIREVIKILNKKKVVFVLDEIDKAEDYDFLYTIMEEVYKKCIILITNLRNFMEEMDDRLKSRLMPELIEFKPYNVNETHGILKQRVEYAFYPGVWETNAFEEVVKKTASLQDMRAGVHLLKDAGNYAEAKASKKITKDHVAHVVGKVDEFVSIKSTGLEEEDREIINLVRKNSNVKIGDLYKIYTEAGGQMSYRTFQRRMGDFEEKGFVKLTKSTGEGGNTTLVEYKERTKSLNEF